MTTKQQLTDEKSALDTILAELRTFLTTPDFRALSAKDQTIIRKEEMARRMLSNTLAERIAAFPAE